MYANRSLFTTIPAIPTVQPPGGNGGSGSNTSNVDARDREVLIWDANQSAPIGYANMTYDGSTLMVNALRVSATSEFMSAIRVPGFINDSGIQTLVFDSNAQSLTTTSHSIVGAINELNTTVSNTIGSITNAPAHSVLFSDGSGISWDSTFTFDTTSLYVPKINGIPITDVNNSSLAIGTSITSAINTLADAVRVIPISANYTITNPDTSNTIVMLTFDSSATITLPNDQNTPTFIVIAINPPVGTVLTDVSNNDTFNIGELISAMLAYDGSAWHMINTEWSTYDGTSITVEYPMYLHNGLYIGSDELSIGNDSQGLPTLMINSSSINGLRVVSSINGSINEGESYIDASTNTLVYRSVGGSETRVELSDQSRTVLPGIVTIGPTDADYDTLSACTDPQHSTILVLPYDTPQTDSGEFSTITEIHFVGVHYESLTLTSTASTPIKLIGCTADDLQLTGPFNVIRAICANMTVSNSDDVTIDHSTISECLSVSNTSIRIVNSTISNTMIISASDIDSYRSTYDMASITIPADSEFISTRDDFSMLIQHDIASYTASTAQGLLIPRARLITASDYTIDTSLEAIVYIGQSDANMRIPSTALHELDGHRMVILNTSNHTLTVDPNGHPISGQLSKRVIGANGSLEIIIGQNELFAIGSSNTSLFFDPSTLNPTMWLTMDTLEEDSGVLYWHNRVGTEKGVCVNVQRNPTNVEFNRASTIDFGQYEGWYSNDGFDIFIVGYFGHDFSNARILSKYGTYTNRSMKIGTYATYLSGTNRICGSDCSKLVCSIPNDGTTLVEYYWSPGDVPTMRINSEFRSVGSRPVSQIRANSAHFKFGPFVGYISEVMIFARRLTQSERSMLSNWLMNRWSIETTATSNPAPFYVNPMNHSVCSSFSSFDFRNIMVQVDDTNIGARRLYLNSNNEIVAERHCEPSSDHVSLVDAFDRIHAALRLSNTDCGVVTDLQALYNAEPRAVVTDDQGNPIRMNTDFMILAMYAHFGLNIGP